MPWVARPEPASASRPSTWPWYAPANLTSVSRPVAARARRIALIDASVPEEVIRSMSTPGMRWLDELGELDLAGRRRAVGGAERRGGRDGLDHSRVGVAEDERAPGADVVHVDVAVDVEDLRALGALDEDRVAPDGAHRAHGRVDAARQDAERAPVELGRPGVRERGGQDPCSCSQRANASVKYSIRTFLNSVLEYSVARCSIPVVSAIASSTASHSSLERPWAMVKTE